MIRKTIITVVGADAVGIIAKVCTYLSEHNANILDISQTIVQGYFNMMMIVDTSGIDMDFTAFAGSLADLGKSIGVDIQCQLSDIFDGMHRI